MNIECDKEKIIFRNEHNDKVFYSISMSKKDQQGNWQSGYMMCRFPKNADIPNKSKIKIHSAWLDFYLKEDKTIPYVFINKYELISEVKQEEKQEELPDIKTEYKDTVELSDADLPF